MKTQLVLGIMSGTSIDSVDYALCAVGADMIELRSHWQVKFPSGLQAQLHRAAGNELSGWDLCQLHHDLGRFYARRAAAGVGRERPALAGLHGQTVFHNPDPKVPATFQLGEPAYLVEALRVPVVSNFRAADLAAGGQGAPLATLFHQRVFASPGRHVCVNNLGGISNVTSIAWSEPARQPRILSFDTGPANMLMDMAARKFSRGRRLMDRNGGWAAKGQPSERLLRQWLRHSFFRQAPPKSTGRELFGEPLFELILPQLRSLGQFDALATLTEFTARSMALNYKLHLGALPDRVILAGGGAANPALVSAIGKALAAVGDDIEVLGCDQLGWPAQAIEPAAFALLAWLRFHRQPGNLPQTTGARQPVLCGQLGEPWRAEL